MCGIFCNIIHNRNPFLNELAKKGDFRQTNPQFAEIFEALKNRGPDHSEKSIVEVTPFTILQFAGSVLWMQGLDLTPQPVCEEDGNVLLWNGDIFSGALASEFGDTKILYDKLKDTSAKNLSIPDVFASIRGPYSFVYYEKKCKTLYFGRDVIGRHSLLIGFSQRSITLSSVASKKLDGFVEVPAIGIFAYNFEKDGETSLTLYPWSHTSENLLDFSYFLPKQSQENFETKEIIQTYLQPPRRSSKTPTVTDLLMWAVQDQDYSLGDFMGKLTLNDSKTRNKKIMTSLMAKSTIQILVEDLLNVLRESVKLRVKKQPMYCINCLKTKLKDSKKIINCNHSKVAVLFSGGLDSAVLACLAHEFTTSGEPIDLLNVAFEKLQTSADNKQSNSFRSKKKDKFSEIMFNVPDRITGLSTLEELKMIHPDRKWNFVEINITLDELKKEREEVISNLIYPLNTVLDDSLGCALWFASRGRGVLYGSNDTYTSPARIVISGIGADEQLGGYMRHRTTLKRKDGWEALDKELQFELKRISQRNLGRDDRVVCDHGRQLRMPFLDEDVINYLSFLPPWNRCYPVESMPPGVGDKLLLRLAAWALGFRVASNLPKKAMQFGSRIANSKERGSDVCGRL